MSGLRFQFDPARPAGQRIAREDIWVGGQVIDYGRAYTMTTKLYVAMGYDGFQKVRAEDYIVRCTV